MSSVWKWSVAGFWRNTFHILLLFLYAFPTCIKQWCPASHCSLLSHLLKREGPMCPQKTFANSVKSSSSGYAQQEEHAKRVSLPGQDTLPSFLNPPCSKPLGIGGREWQLEELLPYWTIVYRGSGTLYELRGQQLAVPFMKCGWFWHNCSEHLKYRAKLQIVTRDGCKYWVLLGRVCDMRQTLPSTCAFFCLFKNKTLLLFHYLILSCIK